MRSTAEGDLLFRQFDEATRALRELVCMDAPADIVASENVQAPSGTDQSATVGKRTRSTKPLLLTSVLAICLTVPGLRQPSDIIEAGVGGAKSENSFAEQQQSEVGRDSTHPTASSIPKSQLQRSLADKSLVLDEEPGASRRPEQNVVEGEHSISKALAQNPALPEPPLAPEAKIEVGAQAAPDVAMNKPDLRDLARERLKAATPQPPLEAPINSAVGRDLDRAEALIRLGDMSGARLLLSEPAGQGYVRAIILMARSYDPAYAPARRYGQIGDAAKASELYLLAQAMTEKPLTGLSVAEPSRNSEHLQQRGGDVKGSVEEKLHLDKSETSARDDQVGKLSERNDTSFSTPSKREQFSNLNSAVPQNSSAGPNNDSERIEEFYVRNGPLIWKMLWANSDSASEPHPMPNDVIAVEPTLSSFLYEKRSDGEIGLLGYYTHTTLAILKHREDEAGPNVSARSR